MNSSVSRVLPLLAVSLLLARAPRAQCLQWDGRFASPEAGGQGMDQTVHSFAVFDDGSGPALYAAGFFTTAGSAPANRIARWDGASWSPLGTGCDNGVYDLVVFDDGTGPALYAGGIFQNAGGVTAKRIARWDGNTWSDVGGGMNDIVHALAVFDDGTGAALYAGGFFTIAGGTPASFLAKWNGSSWSPVGNGVSSLLYDLAVFDDGSGPALFAAGYLQSAGGVPVGRIAKWNGSSWSALGGGMANHGTCGVFRMTVFDDGTGPALIAGGAFRVAGGLHANNVAKWDGTTWSRLGTGTNGIVYALAGFDDGTGPALYAGGPFTNAGDHEAAYLAKFDGADWSEVGGGMDFQVYTLRAHDDGSGPALFVGGYFLEAGPTPASYVAKWRGCGQSYESFCPGAQAVLACPCANPGSPGSGCDNSLGNGGALLGASGPTIPDGLRLSASGLVPTSLALVLQGELSSPTAFGDGLLCLASMLRLYALSAPAGVLVVPAAGAPTISAESAAHGDPIGPGTTRTYQVLYRDPGALCGGAAFNTSNAQRVLW